MAKKCNCHKNRAKAMAKGMDFWTAHQKYSKSGYHEHRCECNCGCKNDTLGYAHCVSCSFDKACWKLRNQAGMTILGLPVMEGE